MAIAYVHVHSPPKLSRPSEHTKTGNGYTVNLVIFARF